MTHIAHMDRTQDNRNAELAARRGRALTASLGALLALLLASPRALAFTVDVIGAGGDRELIAVGEDWHFFRGTASPSTPDTAWKELDFPAPGWETGPSGFGYGDGDDNTVLSDMREDPGLVAGYLAVYVRKEFTLAVLPESGELVLDIDYDDGFVAYLNGVEVARAGMPAGAVDHQTEAEGTHEAGTPLSIRLGSAAGMLRTGKNVLAIEGHNASLGSSDFSLIPALRVDTGTASGILKVGRRWIVETDTLGLAGDTAANTAASVHIDGVLAAFDPATGAWQGDATLDPGANTVEVEVLDANQAVVDQGSVEVFYLTSAHHVGGEVLADTSWSAVLAVDSTVTVPAGVVLTIEAGATILLADAVSLLVSGRLLALGTESEPIHFTARGAGIRWKNMVFLDAGDSRLEHCFVEFSDCEGDHKDYYGEGSRDYHEAIVAVSTHLDIESCTFRNLPDAGPGGEGDAIAIISDDPDVPGESTATVKNCEFLSIGQGVHARLSPIVVEGCFFTGHHGDNDDVDLYGESDPPPLILNNRFINPDHDDMINPTRCSAVIIGNLIAGGDDHGIVLRDRSSPVLINNVIYDCSAAGIAIENACDALLVNNTIIACGRGLRLFDLGREGPPYFLTPGGGTATAINCVIADCPQPVTLTDSSNPSAEDRGSHITLIHSMIEGGQAGISVSGDLSTITWGEGNLDATPLFVDPGKLDFRLQADSPGVDAGTSEGAPGDDLDGRPRPCGEAVDMGAYELESCGDPPSPRFVRSDANADASIDIGDPLFILFHLYASGPAPSCPKSADLDDDGDVEADDVVSLLLYLFRAGGPPRGPFPLCGVDPTPDGLACQSQPRCAE